MNYQLLVLCPDFAHETKAAFRAADELPPFQRCERPVKGFVSETEFRGNVFQRALRAKTAAVVAA